MLKVRAAEPPDIGAILKLMSDATPDERGAEESGFIRTKITADQLSQYLQTDTVLIATDGDNIIGALWAGTPSSELVDLIKFEEPNIVAEIRRPCWIHMVVISRESRGKAVGTLLYEQLFEQMRGRALLTALYEKPLENKASKSFHLKLGFCRVGILQKSKEEILFESGIYVMRL